MPIIAANAVGQQLVEKGLIPANCRRVVIDLNVGDVGTIYYETFADEKMLEVDFSGCNIVNAADATLPEIHELGRLQRGEIYVIEYPGRMSDNQRERYQGFMDRTGQRLGVKFIILEDGAKIARMEPAAKVSQSHGAPAEFPVSPA